MKTQIAQTKKEIIEAAIIDYSYIHKYRVDKRRKLIKQMLAIGFSETEIIEMRFKHLDRVKRCKSTETSNDMRLKFLKRVKEAQFNPESYSSRFNCTGIDWTAYHRPSSNGKGWVLIAPDEPANNWYVEDAVLLKLLTKKFIQN